jgi:hypothetical protein
VILDVPNSCSGPLILIVLAGPSLFVILELGVAERITVPPMLHVSPPPMYIDEITLKVFVGSAKSAGVGLTVPGRTVVLQFVKTVTSPGTDE